MLQQQASFSSAISDVSGSSGIRTSQPFLPHVAPAAQHGVPNRKTSITSTSSGTSGKPSLTALLHGKDVEEDPILKSLAIPCGQRSDHDLVPIIDFIRGLRFFQLFTKYPETVRQVAQLLELQTVLNGGHVFFEGQPGDEFYIVLDGEISIVKKKRISAYMDFITENVTLVKLSCGQTFGETALDSTDGLRTASAVASKRSSLLMLRREDYHVILFHFKIWLQSAVSACLRSGTSIFRHLHSDAIEALAARAVVRSFSINTEIFAENSRLSSLMIVKSGIVRLMKGMTVDAMNSAVVESKGKFNRQGQSMCPATPTPGKSRMPSLAMVATTGSLTERHPLSPPRETPPGYWLLQGSQEYLNSSKPMRVVTKNALGADTITEIHRETIQSLTVAKEQFTVSVLMQGEVLGEICILGPEQLSAVSAFASTAVELYCIDNEVLFQNNVHLDEAVMAALLDDWKFRNPPVGEVKKAFQTKYEWEISKKFLLKKLRK